MSFSRTTINGTNKISACRKHRLIFYGGLFWRREYQHQISRQSTQQLLWRCSRRREWKPHETVWWNVRVRIQPPVSKNPTLTCAQAWNTQKDTATCGVAQSVGGRVGMLFYQLLTRQPRFIHVTFTLVVVSYGTCAAGQPWHRLMRGCQSAPCGPLRPPPNVHWHSQEASQVRGEHDSLVALTVFKWEKTLWHITVSRELGSWYLPWQTLPFQQEVPQTFFCPWSMLGVFFKLSHKPQKRIKTSRTFTHRVTDTNNSA